MNVYKKKGFLSCNYTNGWKYKVEDCFLYAKNWETGDVTRVYLNEIQLKKVDEFDIIDPFNNTRTWIFLRDLWREARDIYGEEPVRCDKSDFE